MQLTIFTDIALKSIMYLKQSQDLVTINEIADKYLVPKSFGKSFEFHGT